jgi:hypothetical protein
MEKILRLIFFSFFELQQDLQVVATTTMSASYNKY